MNNIVDIVLAYEGPLGETIKKRNEAGFRLVGSVTSCVLRGNTYYILTWEKE